MTKKEKAAVYARVSTDKVEQQKSLKDQQEEYAKYAQDNGYELVKIYFDEGFTATNSNRKYFLQMLHDAGLDAVKGDGSKINFKVNYDRKPMFKWIITKDASRFARNVNAMDIASSLRDKKVYIVFETLGFTTMDSDWQFRLSLFLTFAQEESLNTSRKLRNAYNKKAEKGKFHMSVNLLGYERDENSESYFIVEDEAKIVRKVFDHYTEDKIGSYEIGDILNSEGYKTSRGKMWNGNGVARILKNEKFKGQVVLNRYGKTDITGSNKRVIRPKDEWIVLDDAIPKIVSVDQFDKATEIMSNRTVEAKNNQQKGMKVVKNIFYKRITCGVCGSDYVRETAVKTKKGKKTRDYFYNCRNRRNRQRIAIKCDNRGISHDVIVRELTKIGENSSNSQYTEARMMAEKMALDKKLGELDEKIKNSQNEIDEINDKIIKIGEKTNNLFNTLSGGGVSNNIIKLTQKKINELKEEEIQLEASKIDYSTAEIDKGKHKLIQIYNEILDMSKKQSYNFDETLEQLKEIVVHRNKMIIVKFKVVTLLENLREKNDFLHVEDGEPTIAYWFKY